MAPWLIVPTAWPAAASVAGGLWARTGPDTLAAAGAAVGTALVLGVVAVVWRLRSRHDGGGTPAP